MSKYYVVSEEELDSYKRETLRAAHTHEVHNLENTPTYLACRAREVPAWATHFAVFGDEDSSGCPVEQEAYVIESKEIK